MRLRRAGRLVWRAAAKASFAGVLDRASDVYALCTCSAPALSRRFREAKGCTVVEYLTKVKMDYAQSFLRSTNFHVREIAARLGYDSVSHFCRVFKQRTGQTTQEYRRSGIRAD